MGGKGKAGVEKLFKNGTGSEKGERGGGYGRGVGKARLKLDGEEKRLEGRMAEKFH